MLFKPDDFENRGFDVDFKSALPSADLLGDSTLDGGLSTSSPASSAPRSSGISSSSPPPMRSAPSSTWSEGRP